MAEPQTIEAIAARLARSLGRRWPGDEITDANRKKPEAESEYWIGITRAVAKDLLSIAPLDNPALRPAIKAVNDWTPDPRLPPHFHRPAITATAITAFQTAWKKELGL